MEIGETGVVDTAKIGVAEGFFVASTWRRLVAQGIDILALGWILHEVGSGPWMRWSWKGGGLFLSRPGSFLVFGLGVFFIVLYRSLFYRYFGGHIGHLVCRLQVVNVNHPGQLLGGLQGLIRSLTEVISSLLGGIPLVLGLFRLDRRHGVDWVAETQVVQRTPRPHPPQRRWFLGSLLLVVLFLQNLVRF